MTTTSPERVIYTHEHPSYITNVLYPKQREAVIQCLLKLIKYIGLRQEIGAIAACGGSGMAIAPIISYLTGIPLLIVHKEDDSSHADTQLRGLATSGNYIIIDDFTESGNTISWILETIKEWGDAPMNCVGVLLYRGINPVYYINNEDIWNGIKGLDFWGMRPERSVHNFKLSKLSYKPYKLTYMYDPDAVC